MEWIVMENKALIDEIIRVLKDELLTVSIDTKSLAKDERIGYNNSEKR